MTNIEALRHSVSVPVADTSLEKILIDRGIPKDSLYNGTSATFELATADLLVFLISQPNISESGYSLSMTEKALLQKQAGALYAKHGESNPFTPEIKDASDRW